MDDLDRQIARALIAETRNLREPTPFDAVKAALSIADARYQPRADAKPAYQCPTCNRHGERTSRCFHGPEGSEIPDVKPEAPAPMGDAATADATVNERAIDIVRRLARVGGCALPVGIIFDAGSELVYDARALVALMARDGEGSR